MRLDEAEWRRAFDELCPEIKRLLDVELDAGNRIRNVYRAELTEMAGWLEAGTVIIYMEREFFTKPPSLPAEVEAGGPDYQCGIFRFYQCELHRHMLMESRVS